MRIFRWLAFSLFLIAVIAGAGLWAGLRWIESPAGEAWLSEQATRRLQESAPGTEAIFEGVQVRRGVGFGVRVDAARLVWRRQGGQRLAEMAPLEAWVRLAGWPPAALWEVRIEVRHLDLAGLDQAMAKGQWRASGMAAGPVELSGAGQELRAVGIRLEALPPGGDLSSQLLQALVGMMPAGDPREALMQALAGKALFHFATGKIELVTEPERYVLHLLVDGDHLLDITVRVPKESMEFLRHLFL